MATVHKNRIVQSRWVVNKTGRHSEYQICECDYGKDHDDSRSISCQDGGDMLQVARRESWNFKPDELDYLKSWLMTSGEFKNGKLQPRPFAKEIIELLSNQSTTKE